MILQTAENILLKLKVFYLDLFFSVYFIDIND